MGPARKQVKGSLTLWLSEMSIALKGSPRPRVGLGFVSHNPWGSVLSTSKLLGYKVEGPFPSIIQLLSMVSL